MGGECGLIPEIRATSGPIDDPVPRSGPTPITFGTNAEGRPPTIKRAAWTRRSVPSWAKKGQESQGTESPGWRNERDYRLGGVVSCRLCLTACNMRQPDAFSISALGGIPL
jgi:hypothetical protein